MKTVMKKMFCLLLVAVLLVSAVPAAFAEGEVCTLETCPKKGEAVVRQPDYDVAATCTEAGKIGYYCHGGHKEFRPGAAAGHTGMVAATCAAPQHCTDCNGSWGEKSTEHSGKVAATCSAPEHCTVCGGSWGVALPHTWSAADCTTAKTCSVCGATEGAAEGHLYGTDNVCTKCNYCKHCKQIITSTNGHPITCPNNKDYSKECEKCGKTYLTAEGHPQCDVCEGCHATSSCPYCSVCWANGDQVKTHKASAHCEKCGETSHKTADHCTTCGNTNGTHKVTCKYYTNAQTGSSKVKVYVNLYTSDVKTETKHLYTYENVSKDTPVYAFIAEQSEHIRSLLPSGYTWGGNVYDSQNDDDAELMKGKVGKGTTVHINAYSAQDLVYIYVHNSRSFSNLRIVQLHGKKVGETVTKQEVTKAVSKYFNVSGLSMYDEQAWEDYVDGASVESVGSLKVTNDPYFIDVRISGTAKSGTSGSGYTADSSNPKTGDAIFAPVMILGLSASALAVLFYLNKKRAF